MDWRLVARLGVTGVLGAILGAWLLSNIEIAAGRRLVYAYLLLMGFYILWKSMVLALWTGGIRWRGTHYPLKLLRANRV